MKDFTGKPVAVGDIVVFNRPYHKDLASSSVLKITPKGIKVNYKNNFRPKNECFIAEGQFVVTERFEGGLVKQTNFERIKAMTVEEMAEFLCSVYDDEEEQGKNIEGYFLPYYDETDIKQWLESEVQEE